MTVTLHTPRLTLRQPTARDLPAFTAFWTSPRTAFMGGPWTADEAVAAWPELARQWDVQGFSLFVITHAGDDRAIGLAGPFYPEAHPEPELAWNLWDAADEGQGIATEAAMTARVWFFGLGHNTAVSYTHPDNAASHRVAERLGAVVDVEAACPFPPPVRIYRHRRAAATSVGRSVAEKATHTRAHTDSIPEPDAFQTSKRGA
jgi:RimJ/RimL family protein N-acetyltransferase